MNYAVSILRSAQRELAQLSSQDYARVRNAIGGLGQNPRPRGCLKLAGREGWRIRVGVNRVIYEIDDGQHTVNILHVGHRRDVASNWVASVRLFTALRAGMG